MSKMNTTKNWKKLASIKTKEKAMRPIGKYILIDEVKESVKTESGLILGAEEANLLRYKKGFILEVGSDVTVLMKGDDIFYDSRAGYTMLIKEKMCTIIMEKDVVVVL